MFALQSVVSLIAVTLWTLTLTDAAYVVSYPGYFPYRSSYMTLYRRPSIMWNAFYPRPRVYTSSFAFPSMGNFRYPSTYRTRVFRTGSGAIGYPPAQKLNGNVPTIGLKTKPSVYEIKDYGLILPARPSHMVHKARKQTPVFHKLSKAKPFNKLLFGNSG